MRVPLEMGKNSGMILGISLDKRCPPYYHGKKRGAGGCSMKEMTSRERLTRLFNGQEVDRTPIWLLAPYHHVILRGYLRFAVV